MSRRTVLSALLGVALLVVGAIVVLTDDGTSVDGGGGLVEGTDADPGLATHRDEVAPRDGGPTPPVAAPQERIERVGDGIEPTEVTGRLTDRSGRPLPAGTVIAFRSEPGTPFRTRRDTGHIDLTDAEGRFTLVGLPADAPLGLDLSAAGHAPALVEPFTLQAGTPRDLGDLVLGAGMTLEGRVFDSRSGEAVVGARLVLTDLTTEHRSGGPVEPVAEAVSDADGRYRFEHLAMRQYGVDASAEGYAPVTSVTTFVLAGPVRSVTQDFGLEAATSLLRGTVQGPDGQPVSGARVRLSRAPRRGNTYFLEHTDTDARGAFAFDPLPDGRFDLDLLSEHWYLPSALAVDSGEADLVVHAQPTLAVAGRLVVESGTPPTRFGVTVKPDGRTGAMLAAGTPPRREIEGADPPGSFLFTGLRPGSYAFEVAADGYALARSQDVLLGRDSDPSRPTEVAVVLLRGGTLAGSVAPAAARLLVELRGMDYDPSLAVESTFPTPPLEGLVARTDGDGAFAIEHVPEGEYVLSVRPPRGPPLHRRGVRAIDGERTEVGTLTLPVGGQLGGVVRGPDGRPRQGARVTALGEEHQQQAVTDGEGVYLFEGLPPGPYELRAVPGEIWEALQLEARGEMHVGAEEERVLDLQLVARRAAGG